MMPFSCTHCMHTRYSPCLSIRSANPIWRIGKSYILGRKITLSQYLLGVTPVVFTTPVILSLVAVPYFERIPAWMRCYHWYRPCRLSYRKGGLYKEGANPTVWPAKKEGCIHPEKKDIPSNRPNAGILQKRPSILRIPVLNDTSSIIPLSLTGDPKNKAITTLPATFGWKKLILYSYTDCCENF